MRCCAGPACAPVGEGSWGLGTAAHRVLRCHACCCASLSCSALLLLHDCPGVAQVGYCQGMAFVTGIILMYLPEEPAFQVP